MRSFLFPLGSLRNKIFAWSFVPAAIILATVALVAYSAYQRVTADMVVQRNQELARLSAGQLATEMGEYSTDLSILARTLSVYSGSEKALSQALAAAANRAAIFDAGVVLLDDHGIVVAAQPQRPDILGHDWSNRPYFQHLLRSSEPVYSDVLPHGPGGERVIVVGVPITGDRGEFLGSAAGMFRVGAEVFNPFYGSIVKLRLAPSDLAYIVDSTGRVLYHADDSRIGDDFSQQDAVRMVTLRKVGAERDRNVSGNEIVASYAPVPGTPWGLVIESDWGSLLSASRPYSRFLLLLLGLGVVIPAIVSAIGSTRITRPIHDLAVAAQQVASGNFGQTVEASTGDEVEELVIQFNRMSSELLDSYTALREREERLGLVIQGTNDGVWDWQIAANEVYFSPRWKSMLGYADDELTNAFATWEHLMHPDDLPWVLVQLHDYLDGKTPTYAVEHRLRHKDGSYRWILARGTVLRDATGRAYRMAGSHTDIHELKRAQAILGGQREFLELLATGQSFCDTLDALVRSIEEQSMGLHGMVRLLDTTEENPGCASAPSLPDAFIEALDARGLADAPDLCDVVLEGRGRFITEDIQTDPRWADMREIAVTYGLHSCWTEPIPAPDGRILGAFVFYSEQARGPEPAEIRVMETAARLVGIAREQDEAQRSIQRAYQSLERRVAERTRELATLNAVAAVASRSLNIEQILESALNETTDALGLESGSGYRLDEAGLTLRAVATRGVSEHLAGLTQILQLNAPLLDRPIEPDRLEIIRVADYPDRPIKQELLAEGLELVVGIPLAAKGRLVGLLALATRRPHELTVEEQDLLLAVGQQVGVAIENANLYAAEQRRRMVAEGLRETLTVLNSRQSLPDTLDYIVEQAQRMMDCEAVALMRQQEKDGPLMVQASRGLDDDFIAALRVPYGSAASGRAIAERRPIPIADTAELAEQMRRDGTMPAMLAEPSVQRQLGQFKAMLAVPLIIRNEAYGAISLYYRARREFSEEDKQQAAAMADQAALAIESSRLRDQAGVTAAIEERTRLARELHDSVTQSLYSVTLYAEAAARLVESGNTTSATGYLREVRDTAQEALREMRLLIFQLRPPALEEVGLAGALQARLQGVEARGGIDPDLKVTGEAFAARMPLSVQADLYAILQEALNNCLKHAQAAHVWVTLEFREDGACASVRDDGSGFDLAEGAEAGGMGLRTMQERVDRIGGTFAIDSAPGRGTTVRVDVPRFAD